MAAGFSRDRGNSWADAGMWELWACSPQLKIARMRWNVIGDDRRTGLKVNESNGSRTYQAVPITRPWWARYAVALLTVFASSAIKLLLHPVIPQEETPFLFFWAAVMVSAWYGGLRPGLFSTALSALVVGYLFLPPNFTLAETAKIYRLIIFLIEGTLISLLSGALHAARNEAEDSMRLARTAYSQSQDTIHELALAQESLRSSESRFRRLVEAKIIGVFIVESTGRLVSANDAFLEMTGYTRQETREPGLNLKDMTPTQSLDLYDRAAEELKRTGRCEPYEMEFIAKDGRCVPVLLGAAQLADPGERAICFALDLTEQKRAEHALEEARDAAEEASRAKSEFLANISHELRTPMNAIIGMTELALDEPLGPDAREYLQTVKDSADILLRLLNDILDFSRIEAGKFNLDNTSFGLRHTLDDTIKALSARASEKGLEVALDVANDVPDALWGDPVRLRQIVTNLVGNAVKFTEKGEIVVTVRVESKFSDEVVLHTMVRDTGIGISAEDQQRIFAPFTQADASTTRHFSGTGLGLAISQELTGMMGGRLWVESELGAGSRFHFTARFGIDRTQEQSAEGVPLSVGRLNGMPVLVVDDNEANRRILAETLRHWSMRPAVVPDGQTALRRLRESAEAGEPFPLVLVDALMPGIDGFELAEQIQEDSRLAKATILMLSSADRQLFSQRGRHMDIAAVVEKPVSQSKLLEAITAALNGVPDKGRTVAEPPAGQETRRFKILLAEDTPANQKMVTAILRKRGHTVAVAQNGREAVDLFKQDCFDAILMDVQMPTMDGLQATGVIRSMERSRRTRTPIVAMTAHAMKGDRERCLASGMDAYLSKPIDARKLLELIEDLTLAPGFQRDDMNVQNGASCDSDHGPPVYDRDAALRRLGGDEELFRQMIQFFAEDSPGLLEEIEVGLRDRNAELVMRSAHSLKGLAANFGGQATIDAAKHLEDVGRGGNLTGAEAALETLRNEVVRLNEALAHERPG